MSEEKQLGTLVGLDLILSPEHYKEITKLQQENKQLKEDKKKAREYIKEHKDENDYVFLLPSELQVISSILGDKENE